MYLIDSSQVLYFQVTKDYHLIEIEKQILLSPYFASNDMECQSSDMPLGMLSLRQVRKGIDILGIMKSHLGDKKLMIDHTDKFYSIIPHSFGRSSPGYFKSIDTINEKIETLKVWMSQSVDKSFWSNLW